MNPRLPKSMLLPLVAGFVQILSGCMSSTVNDPDSDKFAGGSDEIDTRIAVDRTGRPVVGARIALVRPKDSTGKLVAVSATGKDGSFPSFVVPDGFYSVVLRDSSESMGKYLDSVIVKNQKLPSGRDTLLALGSIRGVVRVSSGHSPTTVSMGLVGTDILATVKSDGTFLIELVPGGLYTLGAFPSMDGYGPLYKRMQLNDGQNLTLPDTLVMPFTGLPSPGALRVMHDTGTGNVRVSWNRVDHPDLLGYVLERVESGFVTTSRYLTDTSWTDSLGASWEAMPLLGPWPSREMAYRVRSRSLSGSPDSKSAALAITANAPLWTKRMDSVNVIMLTNSVTGVTSLRWNTPSHPDLKEIQVRRIVDGFVDCQSVGARSSWSDSSCPDLLRKIIDSAVTEKGIVRLIELNSASRVKFDLVVRRTSGSEPLSSLEATFPNRPSPVEWRDSGRIEGLTGYMNSANNWMYLMTSTGYIFTSDGLRWEKDEEPGNWRYVGVADSLWAVQLVPGSEVGNSSRLLVRSRVFPEGWSATRSYRFPRYYPWIEEMAIHEGILQIGMPDTSRLFWTLSGDSLIPSTFKHHVYVSGAYHDAKFFRWSPDWEADLIGQTSWTPMTVVLSQKGEIHTNRQFNWSRLDHSYPIGVDEEDGSIVFRARDKDSMIIAATGKSGDAFRIPYPAGIFDGTVNSVIWYKGELWLLAKDGYLWKGKLNLPK